jgi:hypothetical protein
MRATEINMQVTDMQDQSGSKRIEVSAHLSGKCPQSVRPVSAAN